MQYKAENKLDIFEFHDAELSLGCFDENTLVFSATHLNIHKHTKQNPGDCDLEIERAVLRFEHMENVTFENRRPIEKVSRSENRSCLKVPMRWRKCFPALLVFVFFVVIGG